MPVCGFWCQSKVHWLVQEHCGQILVSKVYIYHIVSYILIWKT